MTPPRSIRRDAAGVLLPGFVGTTLPEWLAARLRDGLAGVCIFAINIVSIAQLRELTDEIRRANPRALIAIDEEGGDVTRLYQAIGSPYPGNALLGRIDDPDFTEQVGRRIGWQLRLAGCNLNFAPDVDINSNSSNPVIGVRSFGATPELVARHTSAWIRGLEATGVAASAKHFPGHGDTAQDSHLALPVVDVAVEALQDRELVPFRAAVAAGSRTIMTSHIMLPQLDAANPATFSRTILRGLLREELGFDGVIVTDALDMKGASGVVGIPEAAVLAITAGCDLLCIGTENTDEQLGQIEAALVAAVASGRLDDTRLTEAAGRNEALGRQLVGASAGIPIPDDLTVDGEPEFDLARTAAAFDVRTTRAVSEDRVLVSIETIANIAVGDAPWGPGAAGADTLRVSEGETVTVPFGSQPVILGKDNHRHAWVRDLIDDLRAQHPTAIVVDMGWPGDDRSYADVATFGASRHAGRALLAWLEREAAKQDLLARTDSR
ncbi:MAG: beta-N-acetylhexosaminidase [Microbacteriaceae bacterium]|jgi:beta-N-acetylhexosaminidase|nr:beta-N-acetylhexosaminidase [Microbacteriaceae bacterium]